MQVCKYANMHLCKYASMQVCKFVSMQVCKHESMHICIYASVQAYKYTITANYCQVKQNYLKVMLKLCQVKIILSKIWPKWAKLRQDISILYKLIQNMTIVDVMVLIAI